MQASVSVIIRAHKSGVIENCAACKPRIRLCSTCFVYFFFLGAAGNSANKLLLLVCHRLSAAMLILLFAVNLLMLINVINVNLFADVCPFLEKHEMQMSLFSFHLLCRLLGNCFHFVRIRTHICTNKKIHKDKIY